MSRKFATWRTVRGLMIGSAQVAVASVVVRSIVGPDLPEGESGRWALAALGFVATGSAMLAALPWAAGVPRSEPARPCPRCHRPELRPLRDPGEGLFDPVRRVRCRACGTVSGPGGDRPPPTPSRGIEFIEAAPIDRSGITFLEGPGSRLANFEGADVSPPGPTTDRDPEVMGR